MSRDPLSLRAAGLETLISLRTARTHQPVINARSTGSWYSRSPPCRESTETSTFHPRSTSIDRAKSPLTAPHTYVLAQSCPNGAPRSSKAIIRHNNAVLTVRHYLKILQKVPACEASIRNPTSPLYFLSLPLIPCRNHSGLNSSRRKAEQVTLNVKTETSVTTV